MVPTRAEPSGEQATTAAGRQHRPGTADSGDAADTADENRRTFLRSTVAGSIAAFVVFTVLLTRKPSVFGGILDAQARALFHGRWNVPLDTLGFEAFAVHGKFYTYFGIWPSIVRMPVLVVTHRFDGHLTQASMLLAFAVTMFATARLHWSLRRHVRGAAPIGRGEAACIAGFQVLVGAGSIVAFLGSRPVVYHEMELWGIATALVTADLATRYAARPTIRGAITLSAAATATAMSRPSVGFGAVMTVALVGAFEVFRRKRLRSWPRIAVLAAGVLLPVVAYAGVNEARFGTVYSLPLDKQVFTAVDHQRQLTLAANHGSLFGLKFVPTTLLQYARPDAVRPSHRFPWVDFPSQRAHVVGDAVFDTLDRSSSIPASMPGFAILGAIGVIVVVRRRGHLVMAVVPTAVGLGVGTGFVLTIAFVTNRYLADFFPPLVPLALVGLQGVASSRLAATSNAARARIAVGVLVFVCAVGAWISFGLGVVYQRDLRPSDPGYGRGTGTAAATSPGSVPRLRARTAPIKAAPPMAPRMTSDGSPVARSRV